MSRLIPILALLLLAGAPTVPSFADGATSPGEVPPVHDPDAVRYLKSLETAILKQSDDESIASIQKLVAFWKDAAVTTKTKQPIPGLVAWYARRRTSPVALAGIAGLADIGKGEGSQNLSAVLDAVLKRDDAAAEVTAAVFAALKKVADPDPAVTDALLKLLVYKDNAIVAKAADTLGGYAAAPADARRGLFDSLLTNFEGVASQAQTTGKGVNKSAINKWVAVGGSVLGAMNALAHQQFSTMAAARQWFNKHHRDLDTWQ